MSRAKERAQKIQTVANEQLMTSLELESMGIGAWQIAHDERPESEHWKLEDGKIGVGGGAVVMRPPEQKRVQGVSIRQPEGGKL